VAPSSTTTYRTTIVNCKGDGSDGQTTLLRGPTLLGTGDHAVPDACWPTETCARSAFARQRLGPSPRLREPTPIHGWPALAPNTFGQLLKIAVQEAGGRKLKSNLQIYDGVRIPSAWDMKSAA
jgi:hypothetical protein